MTATKRRLDRGGAMLEFAISLPLLVTLLLGIADLGRLFYYSVTGIGTAYTGASFGASTTAAATNTTAIATAAAKDAVDAPSTSVTSTRYCQCGSSTRIDCANSCGTGSIKRMYVSVTAQQDFRTLFGFWNIPSLTNLRTTTTFRVR